MPALNMLSELTKFLPCKLALFVLGMLVPGVLAADFKSGLDAYGRMDYTRALRELEPLAQQGHIDAQNMLGNMYSLGKGVPQDDVQAALWYRKAAEHGDTDAQLTLGAIYLEGRGVPSDIVTAYAWFSLAAGQGVRRAIDYRHLISRRMTPEQLEKAQRLSLLVPPPLLQSSQEWIALSPQTSSEVRIALANALSARARFYGPVTSNETLWSIASSLVPDSSINTQQMVLALLRINPHAFSRSDVHSLKAGVRLRIPDHKELVQISKDQAQVRFKRLLGQ